MKKFKIEHLFFIFILLCPLLDAASCLIGTYADLSISPTLIIRPIIPLIMLGYIFFKEKDSRLLLMLSVFLFILYGGLHLLITNHLFTGISYGSLIEEASYVINYTYNIYLLFIVYYLYKSKKLYDIDKYLFIMLIEYMIIIYFSILSKTSFTTYVEGMGYRSYFLSGNSISTVLILLFSSLISRLNDELISKRFEGIVRFILLGIYLVFLVGTRTGMLGFGLVVLVYFIANIIIKFISGKTVNKKMVISGLAFFGAMLVLVGLVGSETLTRRRHIADESYGIVDINTGSIGHTTGDTSAIVWQINNNEITEGYLSDDTRQAYLDMYEYCNKHEVDPNNNRYQQLVFNYYLAKSQKSIIYMLFGNGRSVNYGEMIMEMELPAILFNFGLIGFILYVGPFILFILYSFKNIKVKRVDINYVMNMFGVLLAFGLSFMAGYVLFSSTCALIISIMLSRTQKEG